MPHLRRRGTDAREQEPVELNEEPCWGISNDLSKANGFELTAEMLNDYGTLTAEELEGVAVGNSYGTALCNLSLSCCQKQHSYCC